MLRPALYLALSLTSITLVCYQLGEQNDSTCYFPIEKHGRWGVVDQFGAVVVEPTFSDVARTNIGGIAPKHIGSQAVLLIGAAEWQCVTRGKVVRFSPPIGKTSSSYIVENLGESMFAVYTAQDINNPPARTSRIIDPLGKWKPRQGTKVHFGFREGLIAIEREGQFGFADRTGRIIVQPQFEEVGTFAEGLAAVKIGEKWGYVNRDGEVVIAPRFNSATEFDAGHARVLVDAQSAALINKAGKVVRQWPYEFPSYFGGKFSEGLAPTTDKVTGLRGYVNWTAEWQIAPVYEQAGHFNEGLAPVVSAGSANGAYIDRTGRAVVEIPKAIGLLPFKCGMGWVETLDQKGYVDRNGKWVWQTVN